MSVDREYRIRISTVADTAGAESTKRSLGEIKAGITDGVDPAMAHYGKTAAAVSEEAAHMEVNHRGLHRALGMIGPEASHAGMELLTAFSSPQMMGIMAVAGAFALLDKGIKSLIGNDTSKMGAFFEKAELADAVKAATEAKVALADFFRTVNEGASAEEELGNATERATALAVAEAEAAKGEADAEKVLALANLEKAHAEGKITDAQYKGGKIDIEEQAETRKLAREKKQREESIQRHHEEVRAQQKLAKDDEAKIPEAQADAEGTRKQATDNQAKIDQAKKNEEVNAKVEGKDITPRIWEARQQNLRLLHAFEAAQPGLQEAANAAKEKLEKLKTEAKEAQKKADSGHAKVEAEESVHGIRTAADEGNLRTHFEARRTMAGAKGTEAQSKDDAKVLNSPEGRLIRDVSQAESILQHGGQISVGQQSQIAALAEKMQQSHMQQGQAIIHALGTVHQNTEALTRQVLALARKLEAQGKQMRNQASPP